MHSSSCAEPEIMWIDTLPNHSSLRIWRRWQPSRSTTFIVSSRPPTAERLQHTLAERRIERAQDLLRSTNLSVTEVCFAVGYSSLGSFSSRFAEIVGETPSAFQRRYGGKAPRIPGCYLFMSGYLERKIAT